jgi:hypothetical protein
LTAGLVASAAVSSLVCHMKYGWRSTGADTDTLTMRAIALVSLLFLLLTPTAADAAKAKQTCRDAKTGQFVTTAYAKKYPGLTVCEVKTDVVKKKQG